MDQRTTGIILRTRLLTDTSLIVHWLTRDFGRMATVAKGARRPKSPFAGRLDLCYTADLVFARSRRSDLHALRELALLNTREPLRRDLIALQRCAYCVGLIELTTEVDTPLPGAFELVSGLLDLLARGGGDATVFAFEMKWLAFLGLQPDLSAARLTPGAHAALALLSDADWDAIGKTRLSSAQLREIAAYLHGFLIYQFGRLPRGRQTAITSATPPPHAGEN